MGILHFKGTAEKLRLFQKDNRDLQIINAMKVQKSMDYLVGRRKRPLCFLFDSPRILATN